MLLSGGCYLLASHETSCNGRLAAGGKRAFAAWLLVMSRASIAMHVTQVVVHQHDRPLVDGMCQQCLCLHRCCLVQLMQPHYAELTVLLPAAHCARHD